MYNKESKKVLVTGLALSFGSWLMITSAIDAGTFTAIYTPVIIGAFFGAMMTLYGITNSGMADVQEYEATRGFNPFN